MTQERGSGAVVVSTDFSEIGDAAIPHAFRAAQERGASLIVIASHGRSGLLRLALGSVAERVIREASCPVLVVR
jgi:nucleotide-binding universal stress UspA family protein